MFDFQNKFARVLDADTKEELKELYADDRYDLINGESLYDYQRLQQLQ